MAKELTVIAVGDISLGLQEFPPRAGLLLVLKLAACECHLDTMAIRRRPALASTRDGVRPTPIS